MVNKTLQLEDKNFRIDSNLWESKTMPQYCSIDWEDEIEVKVNPEWDVFELPDGEQLFTYYAAIREAEKAGKRLPTDEEFDELLKTKSDMPNVTYAGNCNGGSCNYRGYNANYWSSSVYAPSPTNAWRRNLNYSFASVSRTNNAQAVAFSVRCLKD